MDSIKTTYVNDSVAGFLLRHSLERDVSFHMPGHKGSGIFRRFGYGRHIERLADMDITEIAGADNLFRPEGIIRKAMDKYAEFYGVRRSYLLVNGSSGGILAAVLASTPPGGKLIMARGCHKSVFNALSLGCIRPVYAYAQMRGGLPGQVGADEIGRLLAEHPDASAVILPSPDYYGTCSDIRAIAEACHAAGAALIVDEAHGAHLKLFSLHSRETGLPAPAEEQGADIVVCSTHKTLASFTQSAVLHLCSERVDTGALEDRLQAVESSSPSYILMAGLDICANLMIDHGRELTREWAEHLEWFYETAAGVPGLSVMSGADLDRTKINLDMGALGVGGAELGGLLRKRGIHPELDAGDILMCMSGIGNTRRDYEALLVALCGIAAEAERAGGGAAESGAAEAARAAIADANVFACRRRAMAEVPARIVRVPAAEAAGRVCGGSVIPYPPGVPCLCPGEIIEPGDAAYIEDILARGAKVLGVDREGRIAVGADA